MKSTITLSGLALLASIPAGLANSGFKYSLSGWGRPDSSLLLSHDRLLEYYRCATFDPSCNVTEIAVRGPSTNSECGISQLDWSSSSIPAGVTYRVLAFATWPFDVNGTRTEGQNISMPAQEFVTPSTNLNWSVSYPAGTEIRVQLDAFTGSTYYTGTYNFTVNSGSSECVPASHKPVFVKAPDWLMECQSSMFSWSGGAEPVQVSITWGHPGWYFTRQFHVQKLGTESYVEWDGNMGVPAGTEVEFWLKDGEGHTLAVKRYIISSGYQKCYINPDYRVHRWWRQPAAIAGLTIGGVVGLILLGVGAFFGRRYWKKRHAEGAIALPSDVEEQH